MRSEDHKRVVGREENGRRRLKWVMNIETGGVEAENGWRRLRTSCVELETGFSCVACCHCLPVSYLCDSLYKIIIIMRKKFTQLELGELVHVIVCRHPCNDAS